MKRFAFTHAQRLHGKLAFAAVFDAGKRYYAGPLVVIGIPNEVGFCRLGLSVSRKVGNAVMRHRIKRLLRESFRLSQMEHPGGYDIVIVVRKHDLLNQAEYQTLLLKAMSKLDGKWQK
ncbi:MAG: ribonuclease P protein component [Phycisphaeraceae bacterium]|nr:ribonuclease P protein component [Phycisphaeraceae bacterium]